MVGGVWEQRLVGKGAPPERRPKLSGPQRNVADAYALAVTKIYGQSGLERLFEHLPPLIVEYGEGTRNPSD